MGVTLESRKPKNILYNLHWWKEMQMFTASKQSAYLIHYLSQRILMCTGTFLGRPKNETVIDYGRNCYVT